MEQHSLGFKNKNNYDLFKHYFRVYKQNKFYIKLAKKDKQEMAKKLDIMNAKAEEFNRAQKQKIQQQQRKHKQDLSD